MSKVKAQQEISLLGLLAVVGAVANYSLSAGVNSATSTSLSSVIDTSVLCVRRENSLAVKWWPQKKRGPIDISTFTLDRAPHEGESHKLLAVTFTVDTFTSPLYGGVAEAI
jgi:hypothetical protein